MTEPAQLRRGKAFHRRVRENWLESAEGTIRVEKSVYLWRGDGPLGTRGRMDVFVEQMADFVSVVEIKGTDWDRVKPGNRRKLMASHVRQVSKYIDTYLDREHVSVCAGLIYPMPPRTPGLRAEVEEFLNENALQVVWFDE